ncbi:hypothetical protein NHX12_014433 [Muraenolepis orangiensis]|uniref:Vigilin n=1 Tax=Muraenolepis orangiensis TaxID=630683 RepID=A0A9Q0I4M7_9TELE|nr:hypothetical protein NHX12_014433 [Muraenolepis orangiensis]
MSSVAVLTPESFAEHRSGLKDQELMGCVPEDEAYIPTYLEAFPPLPEKSAADLKAGEPTGAWGTKIKPIKVFHVPLEERRYRDNGQFGEGEEAKVCLDIMQRTGAHIELSLAKDQGLSIMVTGKLDSVMKARKEIASATVAIPKEHHRFIIGKNGEKLQELELKTATKIAIPRPDDPSTNIRITGTKEGIEKARHEVLLISAEQDKRAVERVSLEKAFHPFIAGAHNRLVQELSQETGARISIPPPSLHKDEIVITGEKEAVAMALGRIRAIYDDKKRKTTTISVEVKKSQHKYIVGPKGTTLQEILETTGVSVEMPPLDSLSETIILRGEPDRLGPALTQVYAKAKSVMVHIEFTDGEERISLEGPTEEVEQAQSLIQEIIKDLLVRMDYTEVIIEQRFHRHLIGKNGTNINRIKEQYKVSVRIPQDSEHSGLVRIEGDPKGVQMARRELLDMVQRMENERTKDLIVEQKYHRTVIGQKGEKIKEVRDKFPEVIINFPDPAHKSDVVQLRGPKNEVEKCAKFLQKVIVELIENSFSLSIREETNTKIDLPTENSHSEMIVITGRRNHCEAARERILAIQRDLANIKEMEVAIPAKLHNSLIGSKGCLVRAVMEECGGVHIHFPSEGSGSDKVTIRGPAAELERARRQLLKLQVNNFTAELQAKPEYHRFLIGKGGANIRRVRDRTGARIIFPAADDREQECITIVGREEAVKLAQKELEALVKNLVLRELAEEYGGVAVSFPRTGAHSQRVSLKGAKDCVEGAKRRIQDIVEELESQVSVEVCVLQRYHRAVMGPKGCRIQQLTKEHQVQVKFPERDDSNTGPEPQAPLENGEASPDGEYVPRKCDIITISGRAEKCELARAALLALVPVTEDVTVSYGLHRFIIGQKGSGIRRMMEEYEVNIWVPQPDQQWDVVRVTGQVTNVERAKLGLLERVGELQAEQEDRALRSFKVSLSVEPKFHPKIIGRKGAVISQIRRDHDVSIQFPDKGDDQQDVIVISGYERNVEEARGAVQRLVAELQEMVDIRFPAPGCDEPDRVVVTGLPEAVDNAIDHLLNLEEEYMLSVTETETMAAYMKPPAEDFPTFGASVAPKQTSAWGPKKF